MGAVYHAHAETFATISNLWCEKLRTEFFRWVRELETLFVDLEGSAVYERNRSWRGRRLGWEDRAAITGDPIRTNNLEERLTHLVSNNNAYNTRCRHTFLSSNMILQCRELTHA